MGKTNKANRTKGNTRPSSSGHSADLLGVGGRALGGFIGFDALKGGALPAYVPVTGQQDAAAAADTAVDSDFRMVMRKMLKRDAITRLKAVQEFGGHCAEKDKETVKSVLPFWPRLFNRLALDHDRRVREATHHANGKLVQKVSRDVAPFLKGVMGVWMMGQCDPHPPASSAAQDTFARTFPQAKQAEALLFCRGEIVAYFKDNLFEQTVKSLSEPNTATPEDMENKYNLVISSTLHALKLFVVTVKSGEGIREDVTAVIANGKFWKYAKSKESQIRGAWYSLMASICRLMPDVFEGTEKKKLAMTAFSCLSESDPIVAPCIWECALSIAVNLEDCWQGVDVHKVLLPQLWSLVQGGGRGNAGALYPCLLPLLSRLPPDIAQSQAFLQQLFAGLAKSLTLDCVKRSTTECDAILSALFECLQFMGCTRLDEEGPKLMDDVLTHQVVPLLERTLHGQDCGHLAISRLCPLLGGLLARLEKSRGFLGVLEGFWGRVLPAALGVFVARERWEAGVVFLAYFFNSLLETEGRREKKTVRFKDEEEETEQEEAPSSAKRSSGVLANKGSVSFPRIVEFCAKLCAEIDKVPSRSLGYTRLLEEILTSASNECIVEELAKSCLEDGRDEQKPTPRFVEKIVLRWMREAQMEEERLDCLVNITLLSCSFVSPEESKEILDLCCKLEASAVEHLLRRGLVVCRDAPFFRVWLVGSSCCGRRVLGRLEEIVKEKKLLAGEDAPKREVEGCARVLQLCLLDADAELLIDDETLENLLGLLRDLLAELFGVKGADEISGIALSFIHDVAVAVFKVPKRCWSFAASEELVYQLFNSFLKNAVLFELSGQVSQVLFNILGAAIDSYVADTEMLSADSSLIVRMAQDLNVFLLSLENQKEASHLQGHCMFLVSSVRKSLAGVESSAAVSRRILKTILPSVEMWAFLREGLTVNFLPFFLRKKIFFPLSFNDELFFYPQDRITRLTLASQVVAGFLCNGVSDFGAGGGDVPERNYVVEHVPHLLWCLTFCKSIRKRLDECKESFEKKLERSCLKMLSLLQPTEIDEVIQKIFDLSLRSGEWALCLQNLGEVSVWNLGESRLHRFAADQFESSSALATFEGSEKYMLRQVLIPYLPFEKKLLHFEELLIELNGMDNLEDKNFCGKMAEVCFYFQDGLLLKSLDLQTLLMPIFRNIAPYLQEQKGALRGTYHLQIESIVSSAVQRDIPLLNSEVWDFFMEEFLKLIIEGRSECLESPQSLVDLHRVLCIFTTLSKLFLASRDEDFSEETLLDWKPPPLPHLFHTHIIQLYIRVAMREEGAFLPESCCLVLGEMLEAVQYLPGKQVVETLLAPGALRLQEVVAFLSSTVRQLQLASHTMLTKMMPLLPELLRDPTPSEEESEEENEKGEEFERIPPELGLLLDRLRFLDEVVTSMLAEVGVGEGVCTVLPYTDSYCLCMAYLLAWMQVMEFVAAAPSQVRLGYASDLRDKGLLPSLFDNVFRLMPENPLACLRKGMGVVGTPRKEDMRALFLEPPMLNTGTPSPEEIQCVACHVFAMALRKVPASIRTWWNNLDRKSADIVNNFTSRYVSSHLCAAEIQAVHEHGKKFENLTVQGRPGSREVIATYTIDEASIELCVQLPPNHPLGPISVERRGRVGVGQLEWRQWLLQLNSTLNYQNGSILDGLAMWKRNLDQKFKGVEECMICYYVLHSSTLRLPRLSCHVCRKKFHSDCLYKWFHTSNNFTCPLCRNEFRM